MLEQNTHATVATENAEWRPLPFACYLGALASVFHKLLWFTHFHLENIKDWSEGFDVVIG